MRFSFSFIKIITEVVLVQTRKKNRQPCAKISHLFNVNRCKNNVAIEAWSGVSKIIS